MRLTLRTLLGYLDDILEPRQTKLIGEKISESGYAAALVARIREVIRRRRITAPEVSGPGSDPDPNVTAEYLDNTLPPEKVEDLERLCLESDVHLAEVASCHQILTMVLGEPVDVPPSTRERMYSLGAVEGAGEARTVASEPVSASPTAPAPKREVPEYLTRGTSWRRMVPGAAALLVIGVWLGLIFSDPNHSWRVWEQADVSDSAVSSVASTPDDAVDSLDAGNVPPPAQPPEPQAMETDSVVAAVPEPANIEASAMPDSQQAGSDGSFEDGPPTAFVAIAPGGAAQSDASDAPIAEPESPRGVAAGDDATESDAIPPVESKLLYNAKEGVLLRLDETNAWQMLPRRTLLHPGDDLASPEPFDSSIQVLDSDFEIVLAGGSRISLTPAGSYAGVAVGVDRGRVIFRRSPTAPLPESPPLEIHIGRHHYVLELTQPGAELGLEITRQPSSTPQDRPQQPAFDGGLFLTSGAAVLTPENGEPIQLTESAAFLQFVDGRPVTVLQSLLDTPEWMTPLTGGAAVVAQQTARQFEESFQLGVPVDATIPALVESRHPRISELAAKTLILTDNLVGMVRALSAPHEEAREAAIVGLGTWIRRDPQHAALLDEELHRVFMEDQAGKLQQLVWGFGPQDAQNLEVSADLVAWLSDEEVAVREAAFYHIRRLTGGQLTYRYHPDRSESQRSMSIRQWENHLQKNGALVEPAPTPLPDQGDDIP